MELAGYDEQVIPRRVQDLRAITGFEGNPVVSQYRGAPLK
jgi:hypothetical protein